MEQTNSNLFNIVPPTLASHSDLFYRALLRFKSRAKTLIIITLITSLLPMLIGLIFGIGSSLLISSIGLNSLIAIITISISAFAALILIITITVWGQISLYTTTIATENISISSAFSQSQNFIGRYIWLSILYGLIITLGLILFFIPAIIFAVWFCFCYYLIITDNVSAFDSLLLSREYVKKRALAVFGRLIFLIPFYIGPLLISLLLDSLLDFKYFSFLTNLLISIFITPFALSYIFELLLSLKEVKGKYVYDSDNQPRTIFTIIPIISLIAIIAIPLITFTLLIDPSKHIEKAITIQRESNFFSIQSALERYQLLNNRYPSSLNDLIERGELGAIPENFEYKGKISEYELCFTLTKEKLCRTNQDFGYDTKNNTIKP